MNLLALDLQKLSPEDARKRLLHQVRDRKSANVEVLRMLSKLDEGRLATERDFAKQCMIAQEIIETNNVVYDKMPDPFLLYRNGQLSLFVKDNTAASGYFRRAADTASEGTYFKAPAERLAAKLSEK
jgi:hypothetical protein